MKPFSGSAVVIAAATLLFVGTDLASAQDLHPSRRPSPVGIARTHIGDAYVKVTYGRPYVRNRQIFGQNSDDQTFLVPFGELWRTGANEATEITFTAALLIDGHRLDAGTYAIFTVPGEHEWEVRFSGQLGLDGTNRLNPVSGDFEPAYDPSQDVLTIDATVHQTAEAVEQMTMSFEDTDAGVDLVLRWERSEIRIPLQEAS